MFIPGKEILVLTSRRMNSIHFYYSGFIFHSGKSAQERNPLFPFRISTVEKGVPISTFSRFPLPTFSVLFAVFPSGKVFLSWNKKKSYWERWKSHLTYYEENIIQRLHKTDVMMAVIVVVVADDACQNCTF